MIEMMNYFNRRRLQSFSFLEIFNPEAENYIARMGWALAMIAFQFSLENQQGSIGLAEMAVRAVLKKE